MDPKEFAEMLEIIGWRQGQLAKKLNCAPAMVCRWGKSGKVPHPVALWLASLAGFHTAKPPPTDWRKRKWAASLSSRQKTPKMGTKW